MLGVPAAGVKAASHASLSVAIATAAFARHGQSGLACPPPGWHWIGRRIVRQPTVPGAAPLFWLLAAADCQLEVDGGERGGAEPGEVSIRRHRPAVSNALKRQGLQLLDR